MRLLSLAAAIAISVPLSATAAYANLVTNGSFEIGIPPDPVVGFTTVNAGGPNITNWIVGGNSVDYIGNYWQASDGQRSIDLSGNAAGSLSQFINVQQGKIYKVAFDMAGNPDQSGVKQLQLTVGVQNSQYSFTNFPGVPTKANMGWVTNSFTFQAASTGSTLLTFASLNKSAYEAALDNVVVSAVPLPASLPLFGLALLGLGGVTLVRRRKTEASQQVSLLAA